MTVSLVVATLVAACAAFAVLGILWSRRQSSALEDYVTARGSLGTWGGASTLIATALGAWILFGPAEAATWGGIAAVMGYAIGTGAVCFAFIPLGRRMRAVIPDGHSLTEFLWHRFGRAVYAIALLAMLLYVFIFLTAEMTGIAQIVALIADVPLWLTAAVVMATTLAYTLYGGLRASIFTDGIQLVIILPVILTICIAGWAAVGGIGAAAAGLAETAPQLADPTFRPGVEGGLALFLAVMLTNLFHQGYWQRVFAARNEGTLVASFSIAGIVSGVIVLAVGLFGLAYVALGHSGSASSAVFVVLADAVPQWMMLVVLAAALALVMSSADTIINAVTSIIVVDLPRAVPQLEGRRLLGVSRALIIAAAIVVVAVASQGYSVLYLFLIADLICAAVAFPVFFGLYNARYTSAAAIVSIVAGLVAGAWLFPDPTLATGSLFGAFALAFIVPVIVSLASLMIGRGDRFSFERLRAQVKPLTG